MPSRASTNDLAMDCIDEGRAGRNVRGPVDEFVEGHGGRLGEVEFAEARCSSSGGEAGAFAVGADLLGEEPADPGEALLVVRAFEFFGHRQSGVAEGEVEVVQPLLRGDRDVLLLLGTGEDDLAFPVLEVAPGHVGADAEFAGDLRLDVEAEHLPGNDGAVVDRQVGVADEGGVIDLSDGADALAAGACSTGIEGELLGAGSMDGLTAFGAVERLLGSDVEGRLLPVPVRAEVGGQPREHQANDVEQLGRGAERRADPGDSGALPQSKGGGYMADGVDIGAGGLSHASTSVRRQSFDIAAGAFGVEDSHGQGGFARTGDAGDGDEGIQRHVDVDVLQVVHAGAAHLDRCGRGSVPGFGRHIVIVTTGTDVTRHLLRPSLRPDMTGLQSSR
jgi:hypothetical protein